MIDDKTISDTTQGSGDETPKPARGGVRSAAKKATKKAAKKTAKKVTKKTAKKTAKKAAATSGDGRAKKKRAAAKPAAAPTAVPVAASPPPAAPPGAAPDAAVPANDASATAAPATVAPETAAAPATTPSDAAESALPSAARRTPSADAPRRIAPMPPGARKMDAAPEELGGLGGFLALWGPLIIIGFLVLVFRGGMEREAAVAGGHDAAAPTSAVASVTAGTERPQVSGPAPVPDGAVLARAIGEAGASPLLPPASRVAAAWADSEAAWPAPPGPYRNPGSRAFPAGEGWAAGIGGWTPARSRGAPGYGAGDAPTSQWVRCAAPYYWCPAPSGPTW